NRPTRGDRTRRAVPPLRRRDLRHRPGPRGRRRRHCGRLSKATDAATGTVTGDTATATPGEPGSSNRWQHRTFGPASEQPYRRRTSDWIRFAFAFVLLVGTCFHFNDLTESERDL